MSIKERLAKVERRRHGGVTLADGGLPVILVEGQGFQFDGLFYPDLKSLDRGEYCLVEGPAVSFDDYWESGKSWRELVEAR